MRVAVRIWVMLGVAGLVVLGWEVFLRLEVVLVPLLVALFPTAALAPAVEWLARHRFPRSLATLIVLVAALAVLAGIALLVVPAFLSQLPALQQSLTQGGTQLGALLDRLPSVRPGTSLGALAGRGTQLLGGVPAVLSTALTVGTGLVLVLVLWVCYLAGGPRIVQTGLALVPARRRADVRELVDRLWHTLGSYVRALALVALFDATAVGFGLWLLGVPLVLPLAVLVFLGAFFPYIGAFTSGLFAVLVALAEGDVSSGLAVLLLVLVVQLVDGNVIEPLVMGKVVRVTAVTVIVAVAIGATLLGVLGAFLAVPVAACIGRSVTFIREWHQRGTT